MNIKLRPSGIEGLGDMAWGTHFCLFYETKEDLLDFFVPFFKAGLEHKEFCLCIASEPLMVQESKRAMRQALPDFDHYLTDGQMEITPHTDWYLKEGRFDEQRVFQGWKDKLEQALSKGFSGVRFAANILLEKRDWERFAQYEEKLEETLRDLRIEGLCAYSLSRYSAGDMLDVVHHHQFTMAKRNGVWENLEGSDLKQAHVEIRQLNADLERRVVERTAQLAATNEKLRQEVRERKQAEALLHAREQEFRAFVENATDQIIRYDQEFRRTYVNPAVTAAYGLSEEAFIGKPVGSIVEDAGLKADRDEVNIIRRQIRSVFDTGKATEYEVTFPSPTGRRTYWTRMYPEFNPKGVVINVLTISRDITDRKQAEDALRRSEDHLRLVIDTIPVMAWTVRPDGTVDYLNQRWMDYSGLSLEQFVAEPTRPIHPEDVPSVIEKWEADMTAGVPYENEMRLQGADGKYRWFLVRTDPLCDESGKIVKWYGVSTNIDDRKRAEVEMNRQAARAETLVRIAARLNKQLDLDAVIHAVCEEAINTFKVSQATMSLYDKKRDLLVYAGGLNIPPEYAAIMEPITRSRFDDFLQTMGPIMVIPDIQSMPDVPNIQFSSRLDVRTVVTTAMLRDQELIGVLVVGVNGHVREFDNDDLTLLKAISDQAAQAIANALLLKAANEQHEQLRALSTKLVEAQETERRALTSELHDRVGQNLTGLSINLQNMKAMLAGEMAQTLIPKFDDAQELVQDTTRHIRDIMAELYIPELQDYGLAVALETYAERAASRANLELIADLPDLTPPPLPSDVRIALFRAAQEAIGNVLKHADATQLEVHLQERHGMIILTVEDNGGGFEPNTISQREAQTWGLKIVRERIESIGGTVHIESILGQGTRVVFEIRKPQ